MPPCGQVFFQNFVHVSRCAIKVFGGGNVFNICRRSGMETIEFQSPRNTAVNTVVTLRYADFEIIVSSSGQVRPETLALKRQMLWLYAQFPAFCNYGHFTTL